jgi:hypothetical protein
VAYPAARAALLVDPSDWWDQRDGRIATSSIRLDSLKPRQMLLILACSKPRNARRDWNRVSDYRSDDWVLLLADARGPSGRGGSVEVEGGKGGKGGTHGRQEKSRLGEAAVLARRKARAAA